MHFKTTDKVHCRYKPYQSMKYKKVICVDEISCLKLRSYILKIINNLSLSCKKEVLKVLHSYHLWFCSYSLPNLTVL